jgi:L-lactate dehydrogenase complex protein LldE
MLRVGDAPVRLLQNVAGMELVQLPNSTECCGFGGTFAIKNAETSSAMLADKVQCVLDTGAEFCTAGDNSCLMHIYGGLHRRKLPVKTIHIAQILASTREETAA